MSQKFACSVMASRVGDSGVVVRHLVFMVVASGRHEADGRALMVARKAYPRPDGWVDHDVVTCPEENIIDPCLPFALTENA